MDSRAKILLHLLPLVPFEGWTKTALIQATQDAGLHPAELAKAFPDGAIDAIDYFVSTADAKMIEQLKSAALEGMKLPERIATAIMLRLKEQAPYKEAIRRAFAISFLPQNTPASLRTLYHTIDAIWVAAGDTAADFSFYTKRATLGCVYSATLLFWLNDHSDNFSATRAFLDRRLNNVMQFHHWKKRCKETLSPVTGFSFERLFKTRGKR